MNLYNAFYYIIRYIYNTHCDIDTYYLINMMWNRLYKTRNIWNFLKFLESLKEQDFPECNIIITSQNILNLNFFMPH